MILESILFHSSPPEAQRRYRFTVVPTDWTARNMSTGSCATLSRASSTVLCTKIAEDLASALFVAHTRRFRHLCDIWARSRLSSSRAKYYALSYSLTCNLFDRPEAPVQSYSTVQHSASSVTINGSTLSPGPMHTVGQFFSSASDDNPSEHA